VRIADGRAGSGGDYRPATRRLMALNRHAPAMDAGVAVFASSTAGENGCWPVVRMIPPPTPAGCKRVAFALPRGLAVRGQKLGRRRVQGGGSGAGPFRCALKHGLCARKSASAAVRPNWKLWWTSIFFRAV